MIIRNRVQLSPKLFIPTSHSEYFLNRSASGAISENIVLFGMSLVLLFSAFFHNHIYFNRTKISPQIYRFKTFSTWHGYE